MAMFLLAILGATLASAPCCLNKVGAIFCIIDMTACCLCACVCLCNNVIRRSRYVAFNVADSEILLLLLPLTWSSAPSHGN